MCKLYIDNNLNVKNIHYIQSRINELKTNKLIDNDIVTLTNAVMNESPFKATEYINTLISDNKINNKINKVRYSADQIYGYILNGKFVNDSVSAHIEYCTFMGGNGNIFSILIVLIIFIIIYLIYNIFVTLYKTLNKRK